MDDTTQKDLKKIEEAILKELGSVEAIYLFGSVAKETQNEKSDYDIAIFVKSPPADELDALTNIRLSLFGKITRPLEPFVLSLDDLKYSSPFLYEVYNNHRLLYGKNVIVKCKDIIKNIRPIVKNGVKIGYYV